MAWAHRIHKPFHLGHHTPDRKRRDTDTELTSNRIFVLVMVAVMVVLFAALVMLSSLGVLPENGGNGFDYWMMP